MAEAIPIDESDCAPVEQVELMTERARDTLRRSLPEDEDALDELRAVVGELTALQAQMGEWAELHHLLHEILTAFTLFRAQVDVLTARSVGGAERQVLLQNWRPCQGELDGLVSFAEAVEHIGQPFRQDGQDLLGETWAVEIAALQMMIEETLKEDSLTLETLLELSEAFDDACRRHLLLTDHELRVIVDDVQCLSTRLLGGIR